MSLYVIELSREGIHIHRAKYDELKELVYALVQLIPVGSTTTYSEIAKVLGIPPRLVGRILKENANPIVIPCHRVTSVKGIGGYTIKGRKANEIKKRLLNLESGGVPKMFNLASYLVDSR